MIQRLYGGFTIGFCFLFTILAFALIAYPISGNIIELPYTDEKYALYLVMVTVLTFLAFVPQPVALAGYYFSGAIGKNWFSHTLFAGLILVFLLLVLVMLYAPFLYLTTEIDGSSDAMFGKFAVPRMVLGTLNFVLFPLAFTIAALVARRAALWVRLLPMISLVLSLVITGILVFVIYALVSLTRNQSIYSGAMGATVPHWLMLGSAAWSLIAFSLFVKSTKKEGEPSSN